MVTIMDIPSNCSVFLFDLHVVAGGYAYFAASTSWSGSGDHGRESRVPMPDVDIEIATKHLESLGQFAYYVDSLTSYEHWLLRRGWAFVAKEFAYGTMPQWLAKRQCVKSAFNTYTDVDICSDGVLARLPRGQKRRAIVERSSSTSCLRCGRAFDDELSITIHHIRPHSQGGESAANNMVGLCESCNQSVGDDHVTELYDLAGIPHGFDFSLLQAENSFSAIVAAIQFSDNLMNTRCEVW